ncbi:hypothetical protein N7507_005030 [Penicillium longicatenatum]|nr:hypothetical protein N7507_005030 [Penicillium longicatenatum]
MYTADGSSSPSLGSNPTVIYEGGLSSDADIEYMTTPEFWAAINQSFPNPTDESKAIASASIRDSTTPDPKDLYTR